jgi:hypothetical protein
MANDLIIEVRRLYYKPGYTSGKMYLNGEYFCDTLEDTGRNLPDVCPFTPKEIDCRCPEKVYGKTCIPCGTYKAVYNYSGKLKRNLILLLDTPHFRGIRIHRGSNIFHTEGCILVGFNKIVGGLIDSSTCEYILNKKAATASKILVIVTS